MDWIKRNLYFLVGGVVALALMGMAGWYMYSKWNSNNEMLDKLNQAYDQLRTLNANNPHPGAGQVDNVKLAKEQTQQIREVMSKIREQFRRVQRIPEVEKPTDRDFSGALSRTIAELRHDATNSSVIIPPNYNFYI